MIQTQEINLNENKRNNEEKTDEEHNEPDKTKKWFSNGFGDSKHL